MEKQKQQAMSEERRQKYRRTSASQEGSANTSTRRRPPNGIPDIKMFSYSDIIRATDGLSQLSKFGNWRFGSVYKCCLDDTEVFVKILDAKLRKAEDEFIRELKVLKDLRHPNLVELVGACIDLRAVVYKFPGINLEECLEKCPRLLTWQIRTRILYQICSALLFLYSNKPCPIVHGCIEPEQILLDSNFDCTLSVPEGVVPDPNHKGKCMEHVESGRLKLCMDAYDLGITMLRVLRGTSARAVGSWVRNASEPLIIDVDNAAGTWPVQLAMELTCFGLKFSKSHPSRLKEIVDILENVLAMIHDFTDNKLNSDRTSRFKSFTNSEIESATNGFSKSSKIGVGGYGSVYKGYLDNTEVAIKMLDANSSQGSAEFIQELDVLGDIIHPHIVRLIGACFNLRALVYEFLPNGSIEDCLKKCPAVLTWQMRTRIIHEICSGLIFLHSRKPKPMVHGDLKPQNILLDSNFSIKISDFGLSRFMSEGTSTATAAFHWTKNIKGTEWYIDPDFLETGMLTPGCDVYAFSVTILRILTRSSPVRIIDKVKHAIKKKTLTMIVDSTAGDWPDEVFEYLASIGLECCKPDRKCSRLMLEISNGLKDILVKIGS